MKYHLSLGSNVKPQIHVPMALKKIKECFQVIKISKVYETDPIGPAGEAKFWNAVVWIETIKQPNEVNEIVKKIEHDLGRTRTANDKFSPRSIDIDLLPQSGYEKLGFIMKPLSEIDPQGVDEQSQKSFVEMAKQLHDQTRHFKEIDLEKMSSPVDL